MTTFAQKLWQDVLRGVGTPQMAVRTFLSGVATADIDRQMASMPPAMIQELREFISSLPIGQPGWDEQLLITGTHEIRDMQSASAHNRRNAETIQEVLKSMLR